MTNRASITAEYMALFRVLESLRPSRSRFFFDPDAAIFLTGGRKWLARLACLPAGRQTVEWLLDRASPGARAAAIARTKWIDDQSTTALSGAAQFVLLGAGFDMRAFRLPPASQALTFELDDSRTSLAKQAALKSAHPALPDRIRVGSGSIQRGTSNPFRPIGRASRRAAGRVWATSEIRAPGAPLLSSAE